MDKLIIRKFNEVFFKIDATIEQNQELNEYFSYYAKDYKFQPKFKYGTWNGKIYFYNKFDQTLPIGFYKDLVNFAKKFNYNLKVKIRKEDFFNDVNDEEFEEMYKEIFNDKIKPRDYQDISIKKCIRYKRGIIESVTGSGKSLCLYAIIMYLLANHPDKKILFIVPNIGLVEQMVTEFKDYGFDCADEFVSVLYSNVKHKCDFNKPILISTWQSIYKKPYSFFEDYIGVLCDEVHLAASVSIQTIMKKCSNAEFRIGLTGTLPDHIAERKTIHGYIGPRLYKVPYDKLINRGILSPIKIIALIMRYPFEIIRKNKNRPYNEETNTIIEYESRNKALKYIFEHIDNSENVLILVNQIDHLKSMKKYIEEYLKSTNSDRTVCEIYGKVNVKKREKLRKMMNDTSGMVMVATYSTMSTGINIKRIHHIIFGSSYKSKIKILQSIGRGLRTHESKDQLILWDLVDDLSWEHKKRNGKTERRFNHVFKHFKERLKYYQKNGFQYIISKLNIEKL